MVKSNINKTRTVSRPRYSDQKEYYLKHLQKQKAAVNDKFSILGRHHSNLDRFIRVSLSTLSPKSKVLDAGCGLSTWTTSNLRKKIDISGIDGEPDAIEICKVLYKGQDYRVGNLYNLDYKTNQFDAVIMREVIEHFKNPEKAVKEVYKVLKPNGIYIITTPNYSSFLTHFIEHTYNRFFGGSCKPYKDDVHPSKFTPTTLRSLLEKYFIVEKLYTIDWGISQCCIAKKIQ